MQPCLAGSDSCGTGVDGRAVRPRRRGAKPKSPAQVYACQVVARDVTSSPRFFLLFFFFFSLSLSLSRSLLSHLKAHTHSLTHSLPPKKTHIRAFATGNSMCRIHYSLGTAQSSYRQPCLAEPFPAPTARGCSAVKSHRGGACVDGPNVN